MSAPRLKIRLLSAAILLGIALSTPAADAANDADSQRMALEYERSPEASNCPDADAIRGRVAARLGYDPFDPESSSRMKVAISTPREGSGFVGRIEIQRPENDDARRRRLTADDESCAELAEAVVFAIGVAIDPSAAMAAGPTDSGEPPAIRAATVRRVKAVAVASSAQRRAANQRRRAENRTDEPPTTGSEETTDTPPKGAASKAPVTSSEPRPTRTEDQPLGMHGILAGGLAYGAAPDLATTLRMGAELGGPGFGIVVGGRIDLPTVEQAEGGSFRTLLTAGELAPCGHVDPLVVCGLFQLGALRLTGADLKNSATHSVIYSATGGRAALELDVTGTFSARVYGELLATLAQTSAVVGDEVVWRTPPISGATGLSLAFQFL